MRNLAGALAALVMLAGPAAIAAGPYDGQWVGTAPDAGDCGVLTVTLTINGSAISGNVTGKRGSPSIQSGAIAADGSAHVTYSLGQNERSLEGNARFSGNQFSGQFATMCGIRQVTGSRRQ
jgi:hypothetical protein